MPMSAEEIIYTHCAGSLFPQPEYYDGRGNNLRDLNSSILEMVYAGVKKEIGHEAARSFVNMVKDLRNTNAKSFLEEFYRLERKEWRYSRPVMKVRAVEGEWQGEERPAKTRAQPMVRRVTEVLNAFRKSGSYIGHDKAVTEDFLKAHREEVDASGLSGSFS